MVSKKWLLLAGIILMTMVASYASLNFYYRPSSSVVTLSFEIKSDVQDNYQVFYASNTEDWSEEHSIQLQYDKEGSWQKLNYVIPSDTQLIRVDIGNQPGIVEIRNMSIAVNAKINMKLDHVNAVNQLGIVDANEKYLKLSSIGEDPYFSFNSSAEIADAMNGVDFSRLIKNVVISILIGLSFGFILRYSKRTTHMLREIIQNYKLVLNLARNDFKTKYTASYLGVIWGFIQPIITILTYWFVFQVGLRSGNVGDMPFILWFVCGIVPWFFFSDALSGATSVFPEYSYLVKKVVFQIELLPFIKVVSVIFVQLFFIGFIFVVFGAYGYYPSIYNLQVLYYLFCLFIFVFSLGLLTSSIVLFLKDLTQIITIILQIGFWFTPIGWPITMISGMWKVIFQLNPMFYIVQGYRDSFVDHVLFIERPLETVYFWLLSLCILTAGVIIFKRLKPHFADVL